MLLYTFFKSGEPIDIKANKKYRQIQLEKLYLTQPKGNFARNLNTLAAMISGIVGSKNTKLTKIASKVLQETKPTGLEKCLPLDH